MTPKLIVNNCQKCNFPKIVQQKNTEPPPCAGAMFHVLVVSAVMPVYDQPMVDSWSLINVPMTTQDQHQPHLAVRHAHSRNAVMATLHWRSCLPRTGDIWGGQH